MSRKTGLAIVLAVFVSIVTAAAEVSAYTQSYVTYWLTTPQGGGIYEYKYWVFNTGGRESEYYCASPTVCGPPPPAGSYDSVYNEIIVDPGPPLVREHYSYRQTPLIWNYEVPILTEAALNSIVSGSIFQPVRMDVFNRRHSARPRWKLGKHDWRSAVEQPVQDPPLVHGY